MQHMLTLSSDICSNSFLFNRFREAVRCYSDANNTPHFISEILVHHHQCENLTYPRQNCCSNTVAAALSEHVVQYNVNAPALHTTLLINESMMVLARCGAVYRLQLSLAFRHDRGQYTYIHQYICVCMYMFVCSSVHCKRPMLNL